MKKIIISLLENYSTQNKIMCEIQKQGGLLFEWHNYPCVCPEQSGIRLLLALLLFLTVLFVFLYEPYATNLSDCWGRFIVRNVCQEVNVSFFC